MLDSTGAIPAYLWQQGSSANERMERIHDHLLEVYPDVDRIAFALYDPKSDLLKTFINSTRSGNAIHGYQYRLHESRSLSQMAKSGECRVIDDVQANITPDNQHSSWLLEQGYLSSFTIPLYDAGLFIGFLFFDSFRLQAFDSKMQRDLMLYANLVNMSLSSEFAAVRTILASAQVARDFAGLRDFEIGAHLDRMAAYSRLIAREIAADAGLSDEAIEQIALFAPLHDVGKIGIPDRVLLKPGALTEQERLLMESHVEKGEQIIHKIVGDFGLSHLPDSQIMINIVACHHEYLDGSGYPRGLKGEQIPIEARIVTVADIFDALSFNRPYKQPWSLESCFEELRCMAAAGKLDGRCVEALVAVRGEVQEIMGRLSDPE
ncbi:HD domain-containing phosphohydrolase [Shewanella sp.]|uniref:HD domain-containing phosphohydrolase n=1 Tax=Shewanella sp. TaxID=50422 RepID=UPI00356A3135